MFQNPFAWNNNEVYYDEPQPEYQVDTAASQVIRYPTYSSAPQVLSTPAAMVGGPPPARQGGPPPVVKAVPVVKPVVRADLNQATPVPLQAVKMPVGPSVPQYRIMEFRVPLCCEGCPERVRKKLRHSVRGVESVHCDLHWKKVTVHGFANPADVLRALQKIFKRSDYWTPVVVVPKGAPVPKGATPVAVVPAHPKR